MGVFSGIRNNCAAKPSLEIHQTKSKPNQRMTPSAISVPLLAPTQKVKAKGFAALSPNFRQLRGISPKSLPFFTRQPPEFASGEISYTALQLYLSDMFIKERATLFVYDCFADEMQCYFR
ncbi:hypothetical protein EMIT0P176_10325 [Pseudomonas sp. IT-P176]